MLAGDGSPALEGESYGRLDANGGLYYESEFTLSAESQANLHRLQPESLVVIRGLGRHRDDLSNNAPVVLSQLGYGLRHPIADVRLQSLPPGFGPIDEE